jgi:uncharacterized cofD-like protein
MTRPVRIAALGGGTGLPAVLRGLRETAAATGQPIDVTAIVTVMDDGGSSGSLRRDYGLLPPGDIRNCLSALSPQTTELAAILHNRLRSAESDVSHPVGNLLLAHLTDQHGCFLAAIDTLARMLGTTGRVLPATLESTHLRGQFVDGVQIDGESAITARRVAIRRIALTRSVAALPQALSALERADLIVAGPGSLFTSIIPTLLVGRILEVLRATHAPRVYVANLMTQPGETEGFSLADHLSALRAHSGGDLFDYVLHNRRPLHGPALAPYAMDGAVPVTHHPGVNWPFRTKIVTAALADTSADGKIRHDSRALGYALLALAARTDGRPKLAPHVPSRGRAAAPSVWA